MAGRKVRGRDEAMALLDEADRSGRPLGDCARAAGIDGRSLRAWRTNLTRGSAGSKQRQPARIVELVATPTKAARYRVSFGDFVIEVDASFEPAVLRRLLEVVASC